MLKRFRLSLLVACLLMAAQPVQAVSLKDAKLYWSCCVLCGLLTAAVSRFENKNSNFKNDFVAGGLIWPAILLVLLIFDQRLAQKLN